jgi:predicted nucleotidyltransferase component of viral defense system
VIPQAHITAWRATAPWSDDAQVEQDLVLSRAVVELFADATLADTIALRGGTALNKLFIDPPRRYSEDIDLVQIKANPIGPAIDAIRGCLDHWLGKPKRSRAQGGTRLLYQFESEIAPVRPLRLKIEINTREHFTLLGPKQANFSGSSSAYSIRMRAA